AGRPCRWPPGARPPLAVLPRRQARLSTGASDLPPPDTTPRDVVPAARDGGIRPSALAAPPELRRRGRPTTALSPRRRGARRAAPAVGGRARAATAHWCASPAGSTPPHPRVTRYRPDTTWP